MAGPSIPELPVEKRAKNFAEVSLGFSKKLALEEAHRCPQCQVPPCVAGCPLHIDIPGFIRMIRESEFNGALERIGEQNHFASICGRVCAAPCEKACVLTEENAPIQIRGLERFAADNGRRKAIRAPKKGLKVAVAGSGPAGLVMAAELAQRGYEVTLFESSHKPGGVLRTGIPEFRLPRKVLDAEMDHLRSLSIEIRTDILIGQTMNLDDIFKSGYSAVFLAFGTSAPIALHVPGDQLNGVMYAEEFLTRVNLMNAHLFPKYDTPPNVGKKIIVIGAGASACDCARIAVRLGKDVTLVCQGTEENMHVRGEIKQHLKEEGVKLEVLTKAVEILGDEERSVKGVKSLRMDYADPRQNGQWKLIPVKGSEFVLEADTVIGAIGHRPNSFIGKMMSGLKFNKDGTIWVNKNSFMTSIPGIFAGGDILTGAGPGINAMAQAQSCAGEIEKYLNAHVRQD